MVTVVAHITDLKSVFAVTQVFFQDTNSILFVLVTLIANQDTKLDNWEYVLKTLLYAQVLLVFIQAFTVKFPVGRIDVAGSLIILVLPLKEAHCHLYQFT